MNELNLHNRYDQVALAGGAMGVHRLPEFPSDPSATWWNLFSTHLAAAITLLERKIEDVFLLDHLDCGAYKTLHPDEGVKKEYPGASLVRMHQIHADELAALAWRVKEFCEAQYRSTQNEVWANIRVSCFIIDLRGQVTQLDA